MSHRGAPDHGDVTSPWSRAQIPAAGAGLTGRGGSTGQMVCGALANVGWPSGPCSWYWRCAGPLTRRVLRSPRRQNAVKPRIQYVLAQW